MSVSFRRTPGSNRVIGIIEGLESATRRGLRQGMFRAGHGLIRQASTEILRKPKSGQVYIRRDRAGRRRRHVASAPGETHANMTGATRRSLSFQLRGTHSLEFGYGVSTGKNAPEYVEFLEFGPPTRPEAARPSLQNAISAEIGNIEQHIESEINEQLK